MELIAIARLVRPRGLRGEIVADILTDFPERFAGMESVTALKPDAAPLDLKIEESWFQNGRMVFKFAGVDTIEAAEALRNAELCVAESEAVGLEEGEYFDWELIGCTVETTGGKAIGTVAEVMRTGGTEILVIKGGEKEYLIPFAAQICPDVDIENKVIRVDPPDGLLEF